MFAILVKICEPNNEYIQMFMLGINNYRKKYIHYCSGLCLYSGLCIQVLHNMSSLA